MQKIQATLRFLSVFVLTVCCLFVIAFIFPGADAAKRARLIRLWSGRIMRWLGCQLVVEGKLPEGIADTGLTPGQMGRLLVSNHISFLDVFVLNAVVPSAFVAKAEIGKWPIFGTIAKAVNTIFIERGNKRALLSITENMGKGLKDGRTLLMFPEGTTSDGKGLLKLHPNLMEAAVKQGAPVLPMVLRYRSKGEISTAPAYVGDTGLFECLWSVVNTPDLVVHVHVGALMTGDDRRELCRRVSAYMSEVIGVEDPLAEKPAIENAPSPTLEAVATSVDQKVAS